jgi:aryl-alcohol dehydrogenase-like predicted oxidoreductase
MVVETIQLGSQGLQVTRMGFGCMGLTTAYGTKLPDDQIIDLLERVVSNGINMWDTANLYAYPDFTRLLTLRSPIVCQEEILGKAICQIGRDHPLVICTKTGIQVDFFPKLKLTPNGQPKFIRQQCEASLKRLGVDCIDLFYLHRIDQTIPIEVSMYEMKKLVEEGKIKYIGLSECSAATIRRAHKIHPITAVQMEYSLWCRGIEQEILPTCKELGIGLVAYSPLGRGFFGGSHKATLEKNDFRNTQERFKSEKNAQMYDDLEKFATNTKGVTVPQLALAWVEAQQHRAAGVVPIPGTTKEKNLLSNLASLQITLTKEDIETIEKIVPWEETEGERYGEDHTSWEGDHNPELTREVAEKWGIPFEESNE